MPLMQEDSFGAVAFDVLDEGRSRKRAGRVTAHAIPASGITYEDRAGADALLLSLTLYLQDGETLDALEEKVGTSDTLTYAEGTFTATLLSVDAGTYWVAGGMGSAQTVKTEWRVTT